MKYCIEDDYNDLLNLLFQMQKQQAAGTVYVLVVNELHIVDTELIACGNNIQVKFKVSEEPKKKAEKFKEYQCFLFKSDFDEGVFKIFVEDKLNTSVELEIIELLTKNKLRKKILFLTDSNKQDNFHPLAPKVRAKWEFM